ncbi:hypothetical protein AMATHDRAFT_31 [Amanita thiersii Skay4041]|uniref:REJ domain-containing protein n=1 Tax=Amanita thiersii Skay4041 TaxID=703135 RepID=A0A2A9P1A2_9AGAR|nr:hypothetical protein AMATHDRAFT_31 [Amanita thiersii Skay4041]
MSTSASQFSSSVTSESLSISSSSSQSTLVLSTTSSTSLSSSSSSPMSSPSSSSLPTYMFSVPSFVIIDLSSRPSSNTPTNTETSITQTQSSSTSDPLPQTTSTIMSLPQAETTTTTQISNPTTTTSTTTTSPDDTTTTSPTPPTTTSIPPTTTSTETSTTTNTSTPPETTTQPPVMQTTLHSTIFVTTTDNRGSVTTTAPAVVTSLMMSTDSGGGVVTITQVQINPTLNSNGNRGSEDSSFFSNTGAVAGTFILVGLAAASILLWIIFAVRRRRRTRRLEHETAVSATLAAAGFNRAPLDDDDNEPPKNDVEMNQRTSSRVGLATMPSQLSRNSVYFDALDADVGEPFNPYADFGVQPGREGYTSATHSSDPALQDLHGGPYRDRNGSGSTGYKYSHSASHSAGSYEPLLASYYRQSTGSPPTPTIPLASAPRNIAQEGPPNKPRESERSSVYDTEDTDDRLDPNIRQRLGENGDTASAREMRDEEDYSRPVLAVRNLPDAASRES